MGACYMVKHCDNSLISPIQHGNVWMDQCTSVILSIKFIIIKYELTIKRIHNIMQHCIYYLDHIIFEFSQSTSWEMRILYVSVNGSRSFFKVIFQGHVCSVTAPMVCVICSKVDVFALVISWNIFTDILVTMKLDEFWKTLQICKQLLHSVVPLDHFFTRSMSFFNQIHEYLIYFNIFFVLFMNT